MSFLTSALVLLFVTLGVTFSLLAALGILRMPDIYMRMSASTKAATLGAGFALGAVALYFGEVAVTTRALATIAFLVLTIPVASHMLGRAAYFVGVPLWDRSVLDQLRGRYDFDTHLLGSDVPDLADHRPTERPPDRDR